MAKKVEVSLNYLIELEKRDLKLDMLEAGGVDNWQWYGESLHPSMDCGIYKDYDTECEKLEKAIRKEYEESE